MKVGFSYFSLIFLYLVSCSKDNGGNAQDIPKPALISSSIADGAEDVGTGEQTLVLTFDQNIVLSTPQGIKLNQTDVMEASAAFKTLQIPISLQRATQYTLVIPASLIKGPTGVFAEEIRLSFKTRGFGGSSITATLATANPTAQTQKVYDFLRENYGQKIISGVMANVNWNTNEAEWVYKHTGKYPVLNGFDYVHLYASPANWINYENVQVVKDWWDNKGLITAGWHWNVPKQEGSLDYAFYTKETGFDVSKAVVEGTYENGVIKADIDRIADHLLLLKAQNIPVIWRPLHEAAGKWFWWGAKGAAPYKKLWIMLFDRFQEKGVTNLIWAWTSEAMDDTWYPGDQYVDVVGVDVYNKSNPSDMATMYNNLKEMYPNKMITLSEFGNVAQVTAQWNSGATWSWMMPWYDYDRTVDISSAKFNEKEHTYADIAYWTKVFADQRVLSRDRMPDLK